MSFPRVLQERVRLSRPLQCVLLLAGIAALGYGQYLMGTMLPQGRPSLNAEVWNSVYRLEIPNYQNAYIALRYFLVGILLCALAVMPLPWKYSVPHWDARSPAGPVPRAQLLAVVIGLIFMTFLLMQLGRHLYRPLYLLLWIAAMLGFSHFWWAWDKRTGRNESPGIGYIDWFWITALLLLGFLVGSYALRDIPIAIIRDEDHFWFVASAIARGQISPVFFDTGVFTFPVASSVLQGWVLRLFGIDLWSWRFASTLAGMSVIVPLYLLAREWFGRRIAVAACVLMIANPYYLSFCRLGYNNSQALLPVTLGIYFFALAVSKSSYFYLWLAGVTSGLGFYTYSAAWLALVVLMAGSLLLRGLKVLQWKSALAAAGVLLLGWLMVVAPRLAFLASGDRPGAMVYKLFEASFANVFYGRMYYGMADLVRTVPLIEIGEEHTLFYDPLIYGELLYRGAVRTFLAFFDPYLVQNHFLVAGLAGVITPVFFLLGLLVCLRNSRQLPSAMICLWLFAGTVLLSVLSAFPPAQTHLVPLIPALALTSALGLSSVVQTLTGLLLARLPTLQERAHASGLAILCLVILFAGIRTYYVTMPRAYAPAFENIPLWAARRVQTPVRLIYVGDLENAYRLGLLLNTSGVSHEYQAFRLDEFSPAASFTTAPTILFVESQMGKEIPWLETFLEGYHPPVPYHDTEGQLIGYAITNTDVALQPEIAAHTGIRSLVTEPVRYVLLLLAGILLALGSLAAGEARNARARQRNLS